MAWQYALYVHTVAARGRQAYNIPMYVNTWLGGEDATPGEYPSGGPQPRVVDIWKAAGASLNLGPGKSLDFYAPDLYAPDFMDWCRRYHRDGNTLFIPETRSGEAGEANVFYAIGEQAAIGFSPFAIDSAPDPQNDLGLSYKAIAAVAPLLLQAQTSGDANAPDIHGFTLDKAHSEVEYVMQGYTVHISLDQIFDYHADTGFGIIMDTGKDQFLGVGEGFRVLITPRSPSSGHIGFAAIEDGTFHNGEWIAGRRLNGDETDQGSYWRFDRRDIQIEKATVYRF